MDIAGPRIATGGGDGSVRIWSIQALFATRKSLHGENDTDASPQMAQFSHKGYVSSDTSDAEALSGMEEDEDSAVAGGKGNSKKRKRQSFAGHDEGKGAHRLLCKLSSHSGSVLALRFSTMSTYLASAGDDSHVIIYAQTSASMSGSATGANGHVSRNHFSADSGYVENWTRVRICRGHNLDVVGLAWAPDDSHLISCSLDSDAPICVWRMDMDKHDSQGHARSNNAIMQPYKILGVKEHTSTVKGVAFDPAGKYIASSGDDPALCIWRAFDDWGLESKVDSSSGIFQQDVQSLANLSMFRRISFAPDGTHVCATNAMLKKKNIAAMVSREGWGVSAKKNVNVAGAANLVGHKQPVVSSRHCPFLFGKSEEDENVSMDISHDDDDGNHAIPEYSTLVALGDKKGFVTIWSTKKSRPIFKLQCSESRCTVTDMAWGVISRDGETDSTSPYLILLVSLLDGYTVALRFDTKEEIGSMLSKEQGYAVFRHKYGIDLSSVEGMGRTRKRLVDDTSGPKLIENVLQLEMEENDEVMEDENEASNDEKKDSTGDGPYEPAKVNTIINVRKKQVESISKTTGKKRIQPVLITNDGVSGVSDNQRLNGVVGNQDNQNVPVRLDKIVRDSSTFKGQHGNQNVVMGNIGIAMQPATPSIPFTSQKIYSVDLFIPKQSLSFGVGTLDDASENHVHKVVASCTNSIQSPPGITNPTSCATITISSGDKVSWRDHLLGAHCTALDACSSMMAVGTYDGSVYIYGTSPSLGWKSGLAFRSHPPLVMGGTVIHLSLKGGGGQSNERKDLLQIEMLVVTSDGVFNVFEMTPNPRLLFKGTIIPAMNQMRLSASHRITKNNADSSTFPELTRIVYTETKELLLILCFKSRKVVPIGGLFQGFIYNRDLEIWMRISDNRFVFSNFFSTLPISQLQRGLLAKVDETVKSSFSEPLSQSRLAASSASEMYYVNEDDKSSLQSYATKSHCEDRLACALMLKSKEDFEHWLRLYIRALAINCDTDHLRLIVDMLLHKNVATDESMNDDSIPSMWWLSRAKSLLGFDIKSVMEHIVIPEMTKNRSLQRLTNEFATEVTLM